MLHHSLSVNTTFRSSGFHFLEQGNACLRRIASSRCHRISSVATPKTQYKEKKKKEKPKPSLYFSYITSFPSANRIPAPASQRTHGNGAVAANAETALPRAHVGDQNRWSLSNNAPFFLCISVISSCGRDEVGEGLEEVCGGWGLGEGQRDGCSTCHHLDEKCFT